MRKKIKDSSVIDKIIIIFFLIVLVLYSLSILFAVGWGLLTSFKSTLDFLVEKNVLGLPNPKLSSAEMRFSNYGLIFQNFEFDKYARFYRGSIYVEHHTHATFLTMLGYTFLYTVVGSLLQALVPAVCAYLCAKFDFKFSKFIYVLVLFVNIIPIVGSYPSAITLLRDLGLYDTFLGYFMQKFSFCGTYFFVYYAFFETLPNTYSEAAEIDGASRYAALIYIILPLAIKIISTVWLLQFVAFWNDYQTALLYMPTKPTLAYGVYYLCHETAKGKLANVPAKTAGCMILALPLIALFSIFKERLMGNISMGGIKG